MDSIQHAYAPALATAAVGGSPAECLLAGAIGASPDIIGFYGNAVLKDKWKLYNEAHNEALSVFFLIFGLWWCVWGWGLLPHNVWLLSIGLGMLGYSIHLFLDSHLHEDGKRWFIPGERLYWNDIAWVILACFAILVNIWFAFGGAVWGLGVSLIQRKKYA